MSGNELTELPTLLVSCAGLRELNLSHNLLGLHRGLRFSGDLPWARCLRVLQLHSNKLTDLPSSISQLVALEVLHLNDNSLSHLPTELSALCQLKELALARNRFQGVPAVIYQLGKLEVLGLARNMLQTIPDELFALKNLKKLWVNDNNISSLSAKMQKAQRSGFLQELNLKGNPIVHTTQMVSSKL